MLFPSHRQRPSRFFHHILLLQQRRHAGSFSASSFTSSSVTQVTGPTEKLKAWESGARMVKNPKIENQYTDHIRDLHDPSLHIKTIEDELKGTIGKALGKQGEKVLLYARLMSQERHRYEGLLEQHGGNLHHVDVLQCAQQHNQYRKDCLHARWELIVHRQAAGFIVGNHKYVTETFPIGEALPESPDQVSAAAAAVSSSFSSDGDGTGDSKSPLPSTKKKFGDQLDWWQRIGRWR